MNKGLFTHIIGAIIYAALAMYIIGENATTMAIRGGVIILFLFSQIICFLICVPDFYKQKI